MIQGWQQGSQVVQENYVERLWIPQSVDAAEPLSSSCSLSTCLLAPSSSCAYSFAVLVLEATGSRGHSCLPCFRGVEGTRPHSEWPFRGWPRIGNRDYRDGDLESKVVNDVLLACFYSVYCDVPSLLLQSVLWLQSTGTAAI